MINSADFVIYYFPNFMETLLSNDCFLSVRKLFNPNVNSVNFKYLCFPNFLPRTEVGFVVGLEEWVRGMAGGRLRQFS